MTKKTRVDREFWVSLWNQLHRLVKLHIAVFPESPIHRRESVVLPNHFSVHRAIYETLSPSALLKEPAEIHALQLWDAYARYRGDEREADSSLTRRNAFREDYIQWADPFQRFRIGVRWGPAEPERSHQQARRETSEANLRKDNILSDMVQRTGSSSIAARQFKHFLYSDSGRAVKFSRLSAALFAAIAKSVANGQRVDSILGSYWQDIMSIAAYSPYCDGMMVDKYFREYLRNGDVSPHFSTVQCQFFTYRTSTRTSPAWPVITVRVIGERRGYIR